MPFREYQIVSVRKLIHDTEHYDGWCLNQRSPRVGDIGTIVDVLRAEGCPLNYVVECSGSDGSTIWLGDFLAEELASAESRRHSR